MTTLDLQVRKRLSELFKRGAVEISVSLETARASHESQINDEVAARYWKKAQSLAKKLKSKQALTIDALLRLPGVVESSEASHLHLDSTQENEVLKKIIEPALKALKDSRAQEGRKLASHLLTLLDQIASHLAQIKKLEKEEKESAVEAVQTRARETYELLKEVGASTKQTDELASRMREEAVFWVERRDFEEERMRFEMHLGHVRELLISAQPDGVGRKLEFIQQELLREINTLGTKAQSTKVTNLAIEIKTLLEKLREQLANVE